ncbi:hypothetical protein ACQ86D_46425 [Streptomyces galilaeus]
MRHSIGRQRGERERTCRVAGAAVSLLAAGALCAATVRGWYSIFISGAARGWAQAVGSVGEVCLPTGT